MTLLAPAPSLDLPAARRSRWRGLPRWCGALALVGVAAAVGWQVAFQAGLLRTREAAAHRLDMLATGLDGDLTRFDFLPQLLEMTPIVPALLDRPSDLDLRDAVNRYLSGVDAAAGAEMLYVLDAAGTSVAASDWGRPGTTIGQDLSFRPYVIDAMRTGRGRFYGVGITSGKPGYYLSYALRRGERLRGTVTVKVDIAEAAAGWKKLPGDVFLVDERGVVILATRGDLKYRPLAPLDAAHQAELSRSRPYGEASLQPLDWVPEKVLGPDAQVVALDGTAMLASARALKRAPWRLVVLDAMGPVYSAALYAAVTSSLAMAVLLLVGVALWQRRRAVRHKLASQAALQLAHDNLESTVVARTAQLRAAQGELVHAGKMVALGQMSAGLVHELNQPLTALRTLSDSACLLLDHDRPEEVRGNLRRISGTVDRLARVTSRLKTFAYKSAVPVSPVPLARCIADAQVIVDGVRRELDVRIEVVVLPSSLCVLAQEEALGSVIINLMGNALDAMRDAPQRVLRVEARTRGDRVILTFEDTGPGIRADILPRLFEPFVTSKPAGTGLGLGLAISAQLVRAMDGTLRADNLPDGGACFVVDLPAAIHIVLIPSTGVIKK